MFLFMSWVANKELIKFTVQQQLLTISKPRVQKMVVDVSLGCLISSV